MDNKALYQMSKGQINKFSTNQKIVEGNTTEYYTQSGVCSKTPGTDIYTRNISKDQYIYKGRNSYLSSSQLNK